MTVLEQWNAMKSDAAMEAILPCCGSQKWAEGVVGARPLSDERGLLLTSDRVWLGLPVEDWMEAFATHPSIGNGKTTAAATAQALTWSEGEQSAAHTEDATVKARLAEANAAYQTKFGRVFLICATGMSAAEVLAALEIRMRNDAAIEVVNAAEEQRKITRLRLQKWLAAQ